MDDSRRYHRRRPPTFARGYGMLGAIGSGLESAGSAVGSGLSSAAGAVGSGLESAASSALGGAGNTALSGLGSIGQGLQSLFGSGGGEAGHLGALGQAVPQGVELAGPSSTFTGPGFMSSVYQGFVGGPQAVANPSAATSLGTGVGQLLSTLDQMNAGRSGGMSMQPIIGGIGGQPVQGPRVIPAGSAQPGTGPIMKLLGIL